MAAIFPSGVTSATDDASNTSFPTSAGGSISIAEGCSPANVNDALRAIATMLAASWGGMYSGTSRPTAVQSGSFWVDTSGGVTDYALTYYDGTDDIEVLSINTTANSVAFTADLTGDVTGNVTGNVTGDLTGNVNVTDAVTHSGDTDNKIAFGTDTQDFQTGGSSRMDISDSGVRIGGAGQRVTEVVANGDTTLSNAAAGKLHDSEDIKAYVDSQSASMTLGTPQATTSGTAIDFTSIPSGTKLVIFNLVEVSTSGTSDLLLQIGDSGGIETSNYNGWTTVPASSNSTWSSGMILETVMAASGLFNGAIILSLADSSNNTWAANVNVTNSASATGSAYGAGTKSLSAELDRIRLTTVGGSDTFDAGTVNISYI